jgi:hypothetical protein
LAGLDHRLLADHALALHFMMSAAAVPDRPFPADELHTVAPPFSMRM